MSNYLNIFNFSDYRAYIAAWLEQAREQKTSNLSRLAEALSVHTTLLSHVIAGTKNLSQEHIVVLAREFELTKTEREYFLALLNLERAGTTELKNYWQEKITSILEEKNKLSSRIGDHQQLTDEERGIFYSSWIYLAAFAASSIDNGQTISQIADRLGISREKIENVLEFLLRVGVCVQQGDLYKPGKTMIYVPNESPFVVKHHNNWRLKAQQKMDERESGELFFTFPMSISKKDFVLAREKIAHVIKEVSQLCRDTDPEQLACLNIDFFEIKK